MPGSVPTTEQDTLWLRLEYTGSRLVALLITKKEIKMEPLRQGVRLRAGLILRGYIGIYAQYNMIIAPVASFKNYPINMQTVRMGLNYLLQ